MSESKHTPGPWIIRDHDKRTGCPYVGPKDQDVATVHTCPGDEAAEANASLIAAAPALVEALQGLINCHTGACWQTPEAQREWWLKAAAALRTAGGG